MSAPESFPWLGLLKWTLQYQDGTEASPPKEMTAEDRAFLEAVMRDGVVDETTVMKRTLLHLVTALKSYLRLSSTSSAQTDRMLAAIDEQEAKAGPSDSSPEQPDLDKLLDELDELRDIVEQIDFARAFCMMNGMPFLLGAAAATEGGGEVPVELRSRCLGLVATIVQNNPDAQESAAKAGAVPSLAGMWGKGEGDKYEARVLQALSAVVRGHEVNLKAFYACDGAVAAVKAGVGRGRGCKVRERAMLFLRSLLTDDESTPERAEVFKDLVGAVVAGAGRGEGEGDDAVRETCLGVLQGLLSKGGRHAALVYPYAEDIQGHFRASLERCAGGDEPEDKEEREREAGEWKDCMLLLKKAIEEKKKKEKEGGEQPMLLT